MPIPERLRLHPANKKLVREMSALCDAIERALESGANPDLLLQQWHTHATRRFNPSEFQTYWKAVDKETFVREALIPVPSFDKDLVYSDALAVLDDVSTAAVSESEIAYYLSWLEAQFPDSNMSDLIYWPDEWFEDRSLIRDADGAFKLESELSTDQILAYAMATSGRKLPGAPNVVLPFPIPTPRN